jgi:hypothetical protein
MEVFPQIVNIWLIIDYHRSYKSNSDILMLYQHVLDDTHNLIFVDAWCLTTLFLMMSGIVDFTLRTFNACMFHFMKFSMLRRRLMRFPSNYWRNGILKLLQLRFSMLRTIRRIWSWFYSWTFLNRWRSRPWKLFKYLILCLFSNFKRFNVLGDLSKFGLHIFLHL